MMLDKLARLGTALLLISLGALPALAGVESTPPGAGPEKGGSFYVTFEISLPWPQKMPDKAEAPQGADRPTRDRIRQENEQRLKEFLKNLTLTGCEIKSMSAEFEVPPLMILVRDQGLKAYPRKLFRPGELFALPLLGRYDSEEGMRDISGAFLLRVKAVHSSLEQALAAEPELAEKMSRDKEGGHPSAIHQGIVFQTRDGKARVDEGDESALLGPLRKGWSGPDQEAALNLSKELILVFSSLDFLEDCFLTSAVYGDPRAPQLAALRRFRDQVLLTGAAGRRLVRLYYRLGPSWTDLIRGRTWAAGPLRFALDKVSAWLERADLEALARNPWLRAGVSLAGFLAGEADRTGPRPGPKFLRTAWPLPGN